MRKTRNSSSLTRTRLRDPVINKTFNLTLARAKISLENNTNTEFHRTTNLFRHHALESSPLITILSSHVLPVSPNASQTTSPTRQLSLNPIGLTKVPSVMRFPPLLPAISATIRSSRARGQFPRITDNTDTTLTNLNPRNDDDDDDERTGTGFVLMLQSYYSRALFSWLRFSTTATLNDFTPLRFFLCIDVK